MSEPLPTEITPANRLLTTAEFHRLVDVPPEVEWFANLTNPETRRAYENAVMRFSGIGRPEEFRTVTRAHIIAWGDELGRPRAWRQHNAAPALVACFPVRIPVRPQCCHPQPGERGRAAEDPER